MNRHKKYQEIHDLLTKYFGKEFSITNYWQENDKAFSLKFKANDVISGNFFYGKISEWKTVTRKSRIQQYVCSTQLMLEIDGDGKFFGTDPETLLKEYLSKKSEELTKIVNLMKKGLEK